MFGIGIYVHATFLLLPAFVFLANLGQIHFALYMVMMIPAVFGCVVLHELGHALTARHYGIETRDITLYPIGGVARLEQLPQQPMEEFSIAVAGPAVNVVIALLLALTLLGTGLNPAILMDPAILLDPAALTHSLLQLSLAQIVLLHLLAANFFLAFFNMLPAFPMDGGRVLRALLAARLGQLRATTIAAQIGVAMAVLFGLIGLYVNPMLTLLGVFVFFAGQQELAAIRYRYARRSHDPLDVLPAYEEELDWPKTTPRGGFSGFTWDTGSDQWIEWRNGRPVHTISVN